MATAVAAGRQQPPQQLTSSNDPWPLFDLFLDVPHPAASPSCPPPFLIPPPLLDEKLMEELRKTVPQISRFAFPEFSEVPPQQQQPKQGLQLNRYDYYAMQNKPFQQFTFTLQLSTGVRLHGHVRRYLPPHLVARTRYDVGRRGERALVILTRASGADLLYAAILKSVDAISSQQAALPFKLQAHQEPQKWFLHQLVHQQQQLARFYQSKPIEERGKPLVAKVQGLELGEVPGLAIVDSSRFILPTCLLHKNATGAADPSATQSGSILPLLRCLGVAHAIRIMSALLSERRVIMISSSPTRLAACSHSAISMLAQGLFHWQHLYIPVMPPHLWQYLAAPYPYLIGILQQTAPQLDQTDGLGEVLLIHLDTNQLETRGMDARTVGTRLPDLFQVSNIQDTVTGGVRQVVGQVGASSGAAATPVENLGQELVELLKQDRRVLHGEESALANMGETAAKATKAVKTTFLKLRSKGQMLLKKTKGSLQASDSGNLSGDEADENNSNTDAVAEGPDPKSLAPDYIYTEGCHNEAGEEEARISFTTFFLCMFGNMRWYLSVVPGQLPTLDCERFLQQKRAMGEGEGTPIWPLLQNICQTQMLQEFVKARVEEVRTRQPVTVDAPLFLQCANYHRQHGLDFGLLEVRRVTRQVAQSNPARLTGALQTNVRRLAMTLTSNKTYDGDYGNAVAQLVDQCREGTSVLFDVMSVIWLRLRDSRGMQWKHGYQALQILRNLLYHGPLAVIAEATDGLDKIRAMKYYENMRSQVVPQVRTAASVVYSLLVDRSKLFMIRRVCANRRLQLLNPTSMTRDRNMRLNAPFRDNHAAMHPNAKGTIVNIPPAAPVGQEQPPPVPSTINLGFFASPLPHPATTPPSAIAQDMMGLFDSLSVSQTSPPAASAPPNPFDQVVLQTSFSSGGRSAESTPRTSSAPPSGHNSPVNFPSTTGPTIMLQPTIVQIPPQQPPRPGQYAVLPSAPQPVVGYPQLAAAPQYRGQVAAAAPQPQQQLQYRGQPPVQQYPWPQAGLAPHQQQAYPPQQQQQYSYPPQQPQAGQPQVPPQYLGQGAPAPQQQQQRKPNPFDPFA